MTTTIAASRDWSKRLKLRRSSGMTRSSAIHAFAWTDNQEHRSGQQPNYYSGYWTSSLCMLTCRLGCRTEEMRREKKAGREISSSHIALPSFLSSELSCRHGPSTLSESHADLFISKEANRHFIVVVVVVVACQKHNQ